MPATVPHADVPRRIFSPIAADYDRPALALSLFQYRRWHRFLLSRLALPPLQPRRDTRTPRPIRPEALVGRAAATPSASAPNDAPRVRILDMATGTGAVALDLLSRTDGQVIAADITRPMLSEAQSRAQGRFDGRLRLVECSAEAPPFAGESFDAVTFAYLLRYVSNVPETLQALASLLRPGGVMVSLDFAVPRGVWYRLWRVYTGALLPAAGRLYSRHWRNVGAFLGPSIREFYRHWPEERLLEAWRKVGFRDVRSQRLSLGGAIVIWGTKSS